MADIKEFVVPDFLKGYSASEVRQKIMDNLTDKLDKSEGSILWDLTDSSALVIAEVVEYVCVELVMNMFPMWAEGKMLDYHGKTRSLTRKAAVKAFGTVVFTGKDGTEIAQGTKVTPTAVDNSDTVVVFETIEAVTVSAGMAVVDVQAVTAGVDGNVAAGRIDRLDMPNENIYSVTNEDPTIGGFDEETDDEYRQRIVDADESKFISYSGCVADYKRWAMNVNGVGNAIVATPDDGSGVVTIVVTDAEGKAASEEVCEAVYNYIMRPDNPEERLAPINAVLSVVSPVGTNISVSATLYLDGSVLLNGVIDNFVKALNEYYKEAIEDGCVRYNKVSSILMNTDGVADFADLVVNGGKVNVDVPSDVLPVTEAADVAFVEAEEE